MQYVYGAENRPLQDEPLLSKIKNIFIVYSHIRYVQFIDYND